MITGNFSDMQIFLIALKSSDYSIILVDTWIQKGSFGIQNVTSFFKHLKKNLKSIIFY